MDGKLTVSNIRNAISTVFNPVTTSDVARYIQDLVKVGVIGWKETGAPGSAGNR